MSRTTPESRRISDEEQRRHAPWVWWGLVGAGGIIIVVLAVIALHAVLPAAPTTSGRTASCNAVPPEFATTVRQQVAQGLHLTSAQLVAQLHGGTPLATLASQQGLTIEQLHAVELQALSAGYAQLVREGTWTQQRADHAINQFTQDTNNSRSPIEPFVTTLCLSTATSPLCVGGGAG